MPRVYLTKQDQFNSRLTSLIYGTMKVKKISQAKMADALEISQPAFSKKLKKAQFMFFELVTIFSILELPDGDVLTVMRGKEG